MNHTGLGDVSADMMSRFYCLLCEADPNPPFKNDLAKKPIVRQVTKPKIENESASLQTKAITPGIESVETKLPEPKSSTPALHIDIQIHISSDASPDQIEKVFESMAKHIYNK